MEWLVPPLPWTVGPVAQRDPTKADMDELKIFRFTAGDSARREIEKMAAEPEETTFVDGWDESRKRLLGLLERKKELQCEQERLDNFGPLRSMDEWDLAEKDFRRKEAELAYSMAHGIDAQTEVVECAVFTPGTIFRTVFDESWIVNKNDVLETEWTKEGLQVTLNGVKVESRTMVVCGGGK
jgi:hypothetical protein